MRIYCQLILQSALTAIFSEHLACFRQIHTTLIHVHQGTGCLPPYFCIIKKRFPEIVNEY